MIIFDSVIRMRTLSFGYTTRRRRFQGHASAITNTPSPLLPSTPTALPTVARPPAPPIVMPTQPVGVIPAHSQLPPPIVASTAVTSAASSSASNLLQSIQQPVPLQQTTPTSISTFTPVAVSSTSSLQVPQRQFSTQISRETADADAKISQLLQSLQNETPPTLSNPSTEQVTDLIKSLGDATPSSSVTGEIVLLTETGTVSTAKSEASSAQSDFQAAFLRQIQTRRPSAKEEVEEAKSLSLPTAVTVASVSPPPAAEVLSAAVTTTTTIMGGVSSVQNRSLQNLPPNTRLVRGPNGQMTLQKVETIELTPEMQQALKVVQGRMLEIERKNSKTPQELAELAQLQAKQQKILSTGRTLTNSQASAMATDVSSALPNQPMPVMSSSVS